MCGDKMMIRDVKLEGCYLQLVLSIWIVANETETFDEQSNVSSQWTINVIADYIKFVPPNHLNEFIKLGTQKSLIVDYIDTNIPENSPECQKV